MKKRLFISITCIVAVVIVVLNVIQTLALSTSMGNMVKRSTEIDYEQTTSAYAEVLSGRIREYQKQLQMYTTAEVVEYGTTEEIVEWLIPMSEKRSEDFDYVAYVDADGNFYSDKGTQTNVTKRSYYKDILLNGYNECVDNPVTSLVTGQTVIHACLAVKRDGQNIGFFTGIINLQGLKDFVNEISIGETGKAILFTNEGTIVNEKPEFENLDLTEIASLATTDGGGMEWLDTENGKKFISYAPVAGSTWNIALIVNEDQVNETTNQLKKMMIVGAIVIALVLIVIVALSVFLSLKPLKNLNNSISEIASGHADLTKRIELNSKNEIGGVVEGFNTFVEKLQQIVTALKQSKEALQTEGKQLKDCSDSIVAEIKEIFGDMEDESKTVKSEAISVDETASAVNEISSNIQSLNSMIETQASSVTQASAAVEQMIGNINSVSNSVNKMTEAFQLLEGNAKHGFVLQDDVAHRINEIETESKTLQEANMAISSIAEQTNLLAMNAAIEAAHAGEAGKGFSVVADEIRKLSETSAAQSKTIGDQLQTIIETIEGIVQASDQANKAFGAVAEGINATSGLCNQISTAMREQEEGSKQISVALRDMTDSTAEVRTASEEMQQGTKIILDDVAKLQDATGSMQDSMKAMENAVRKIHTTGGELNELSGRLNISVDDIGNQVDQFSV